MIYLDYTANTPTSKHVLDTFYTIESKCIGNSNSLHQAGKITKQEIENAIAEIANILHVNTDEIIITSGATESNNLAIKGLVHANRHVGKHIISTSLEHTSVSASLSYLQSIGYEIDLCPMDRNGQIDLEELEDLLRDDTVLVAISSVDSELGIQQPIKEIATLLKQYPQTRLHIDATQSIGKIPFDFAHGDTISFTPHKFYGLNGVGVLVKKHDIKMTPQIHGGSSLTAYRSGTPAVGLTCSIVPALLDAKDAETNRYAYVKELNDKLRDFFKQFPNVDINSPTHAIPHILNIGVQGVKGVQMQQFLDEHGICVSVKSACSSDLLPSKAVMSITKNKKRAYESFRISLSHLTTHEELETFEQVFTSIMENL